MVSVSIIGSGNVAHSLGFAFKQQDFIIKSVYSKTYSNANALANILDSKAVSHIDLLDYEVDFLIIAVSDKSIYSVVSTLSPDINCIVCHTSGSTTLDVLRSFRRYGVLYPVQSLRKEISIDLALVPFAVEGSDQSVEIDLFKLGCLFSERVFACDSQARLALHVSAVFVNNFSNALFSVANLLLTEHNLPFDLMRPIINRTAMNVQDKLPEEVQTGPAVREDCQTIQAHLTFLKDKPDLASIYQQITQYLQHQKKSSLKD